MTEETRKQKIQAVQAILDMLTQNPELPLPFPVEHGDIPWSVYMKNQEQFERFLKLAPTAAVSRDGEYLTATMDMGGVLLQARLDLETFEIPDEWVTKKTRTVEETEIDFGKVLAAALGT